MDLKAVEVKLAKKFWENAKKLNGEARKEETLKVLRLLYPLVADTRGKEVLEVYTELKGDDKAQEKAERLIEDILSSL
ncbi:hypothetical protein [Aquifex sp.]